MVNEISMAFNEQILSERLPNIFELLAQESMSDALRPAIQYVTKVIIEAIPGILHPLGSFVDEVWLVIEGTIQALFLWRHNASVSENFYDLVRVSVKDSVKNLEALDKLKSLAILLLTPYILTKVETLQLSLLDEDDNTPIRYTHPHHNTKQFFKFILFKCIPYMLTGWRGLKFTFQLMYLFRKSLYYSPLFWLSGIHLVRKIEPVSYQPLLKDQDNSILKGILQFFLPLALFLLKFIEWWYSGERQEAIRRITSLPIPPPPPPRKCIGTELPSDPSLCPLCQNHRRNPTALSCSGFVFCYVCIFNHIKSHQTCPVTLLPATHVQLIRLYVH